MTLDEIKAAVDAGQTVHWSNRGYTVIKGGKNGYLIAWNHGGHNANYVGLTWADGTTLSDTEDKFFLGGRS